MSVHDKGQKAERDRTILIAMYEGMCKEFRIRKDARLPTADIAKMTNTQLNQAAKDLYNAQSIKACNRLGKKLGKEPRRQRESIFRRIRIALLQMQARRDIRKEYKNA